MQSVLLENDSQSCFKLGLTQNIAIQIAVKKVNIIFIASDPRVSGFFCKPTSLYLRLKLDLTIIFF